MFPQPHELLVLEIATDRWRSVDPGPGTTVYARWVYDDGIALPQTPEARSARVVRVDGSPGGVTEVAPPRGPLGADATAYGRSRNGPGGDAQAFTGTPDLPVPADTTEPPDVLLVEGDGAVRTSLLVLPFGVGGDTRSRECCSMQFWLDAGSIAYYSRDSSTLLAWRVGTHEFSHVASVTGLGSGETFVSSYSRIWDER
jgi:hypothetical protein